MRSVEVAVFLARRRRQEVLLLHRTSELGGFWHVVAGGVDEAEEWEAAAKRELSEETGLHLEGSVGACRRTRFTYAPAASVVDDARGVMRAPVVSVECVLVDVADDYEPTLNWEHDAHRWCSVGEAAGLLHWSTIREALSVLFSSPV